MSQPAPRGLFVAILKNFIASFRPRQIKGDLKGSDHFGNQFFEIPANPALGKRRAARWFEPPVKDDFQNEMSSEWESWLRGRRTEPPTQEELDRNLAIMQLKKHNAIEVEAKAGQMTPMERGMETFPKRPEYERVAGTKNDRDPTK